MKTRYLLLGLVIILAMLQLVYSQVLQDSIQQQIKIDPKNIAGIFTNQQVSLEDYLANDPQFRTFFRKFVLLLTILSILIVADVILKGFAMWRASKRNSRRWFWALLIINSLGIFPLMYLILTNKPKKEEKKKRK